ncbi:MAG: PilC/PilY family type IV pilus protein [Deltaproteobacteria bacterium]|nr:PilC/PilY family type IV pilus protein [Deltaproteobacteria bacterium]
MKAKRFLLLILGLLSCLALAGIAPAATTPPEGEEALFTSSLAPDALIVLDLSGSMLLPPADTLYIDSSKNCEGDNVPHYVTSDTGHTKVCNINAYSESVPRYSNASCTGPFYTSSKTDYSTNCRRLQIAKRAIFDLLDDNDDNTIDSTDEKNLAVRIGYMRFYNAGSDDTGGDYSDGGNKLIREIGSAYSRIYCDGSTSCSITSGSSTSKCVNGESANSGTPLVAAMNEARLYLNAHKADDKTAAACRQKFVILISDGADTYSCSGAGNEVQKDMYKRRRETVAKAKALSDAGYKVFVVGFGEGMPAYLKSTLNWAAYYGGTDNPNEVNSGTISAYDPAAVTACGESTTTGTCDGTSNNCFATSNDPGNTSLSGYAFLAANADELARALQTAINIIREATYSFSQASIQSNRTVDENYIYEGSFQPVSGDSFWQGHLKKYEVNADGTVGDALWDAGKLLQARAASGRKIYTYRAGALANFSTATFTSPSALSLLTTVTATDLGVTTTAERDAIVGYIRGESVIGTVTYNSDNWKLGDVFRSPPITVGTPSSSFEDTRDSSTPTAFSTHRSNHVRTSADAASGRIILAGANDGQLHAFLTGDGSEVWSFVPPNLLSRLKLIAHSAEPTLQTHQYFVDGPVTVSDAWVPSTDGTGLTKTASDWHTMLIFGEGRGVSASVDSRLWSSSASCDSGFNGIYTATYPYYCGYYGFDVTSTLSPVYKWRFNFTAAQAPYMGAPWSKAMIGRVKIGANEKWVAFVGGGVYATGAADSGKGLFVIDLRNGDVLWSYTKATTGSNLDNPMPAAPAIADTDNDGFVDRVYIGDIGGNMWRFKLCGVGADSTCGTSDWTGGRLFEANSSSGIRPIYTLASVAKDFGGNLWVYWGTGDKTDPTAPNAQEKIFAVKDTDGTTTRTISDLENITSADKYSDSSKYPYGYYINLTGKGEKMLSDPTVFGGVLYLTTFTPASSSNACEQGGTASLYGLNATTGAGTLTTATSTTPTRTLSLGTGIASSPVISLGPGGSGAPSLYVTTSGGGLTGAQTKRVDMNPPGMINRTNLLYWKDKRIE